MSECEKADGKGRQSAYHKFIKRQKNRNERHAAKAKPDCLHGYRRYNGYET
jgi:hypothetical protein